MRYSGKKLALTLAAIYLAGFIVIFLTYRPASAGTSPLSRTASEQREVTLAEKHSAEDPDLKSENEQTLTSTETLMIGPIRFTAGPLSPSQKAPQVPATIPHSKTAPT